MLNIKQEKENLIKNTKGKNFSSTFLYETLNKEDSQKIIKLIRSRSQITRFLNKKLLENKEFILDLTKKEYLIINYLNDHFKNDFDIAYEVLKSFWNQKPNTPRTNLHIKFLGEKILKNKYFNIKIMKDFDYKLILKDIYSGNYLKLSKENIEDYLNLIKKLNILWNENLELNKKINEKDLLIKSSSYFKKIPILFFANEELRKDKMFVINRIKENHENYLFCLLKNDRNFVVEAINANINVYKYINQEFKDDKEIVLSTLNNLKKHNCESDYIFKFLSHIFKKNKKFVLEIINNFPNVYKFISKKLKKDKEILKKVVSINGLMIREIPDSCRNYKDIFLIAAKQARYNWFSKFSPLKEASYNLKNDKNFIIEYLKIDPLAYVYIGDSLLNDEDIKKLIQIKYLTN